MKQTLLFFAFTFSIFLKAQTPSENGLVNWLTLKEAQEKYKEAPKPILIDFYTDWCGWCKHMMKTTYSNAGLAAYINQNFYAVKFDAETKDTVEYNGKVYKPHSPAPRTPHELASKFLGDRPGYPSTVFVTNNFEYNLLVPGYLDDKKIEPMLVFFNENAWQTTTYDDFNKYFQRTFYDTAYPKTPVQYLAIEEIEKQQKKKPKKVLITLNAGFSNTGNVMNKTTWTDTSIAPVIKKYFHLAHLDVMRTDTIVFQGQKYYNTMINNFPLHQLSLKLSNNRFSLPAICILDEELNTIDVLGLYQTPERLKPILIFIGSDAFKKQNFNDFMQSYMKGEQPPKAPVKKNKS